ncbi:MAG: septation protein IspZ [Bacteroidales bacterium]|nr:septation protein IspZ [Bacteroidales bacterium]
MNKWDLFKKIVPGLLPLFVFIAADEIWGTRIGLVVAISFGTLQLLYSLIRYRKFDKFIVADTALLAAMGVISIVLENDVFFKLKPAIIEAILCLILGVSVFTDKNIIMKMTRQMMRGIEINPNQQQAMTRKLYLMFWVFAAHTLLIIISAFFMSKEAWAFISGGLFYILMGAMTLPELIVMKIKQRRMR